MQKQQERDARVKAFEDFLGTLTLGEGTTHENMTVFPVFTTHPQRNGYALLDEAVKSGRFTVSEVSEGGSVPHLKVVNGLDRDVLILDGDILMGAKQNRSVTTTIIIGRGADTVIDVNCVEQGRWRSLSRHFDAGDRPVYAELRSVKARSVTDNLKRRRVFAADQGAVWSSIAEKNVRLRSVDQEFRESATGAADELFASYAERVGAYEKAFPCREGQTGFVVLIGGRVAGCDIFGNPGVLARVHGRGLRSYILDAIERAFAAKRGAAPAEGPAAGDGKRKAEAFLAGIRKLRPEAFPSTGKGVNIRFEGRTSNGFAALDGDQVVHLAAFRDGDGLRGGQRHPGRPRGAGGMSVE